VAQNSDGERVLQLLLDDGLPVSQASRLAHAITGVNRKTLYQRALDLQGRAQPVDGQRLSLADE
jgi:16S rRNA (cytidine1402-2'-O)-methyltransferase